MRNPVSPHPPQPRPPAPRARRPLIFLFCFALLAFLFSLPWQRQQWEKARRMQEETRVQQLRLNEVTARQEQDTKAGIRLQNAPITDLSARMDAAQALLSRGDVNGAAKLLQQVETAALADPARASDPALAATLAGLFQQTGWIDRALVNAQRAFRLAPNNLAAVLRLALLEAQLGWQDDCREHLALARKISPNAAEPYLGLALLNDQIGARDEAEKELMTADKLRPGDASIALLLYQNRLEHRRYDAALTAVEEALRLHPADPGLLNARAEALIERALSQAGKVNPAQIQAGLEAAQTYQKLAPDDPNIHFLIGKALLGKGDEAGAAREWEQLYALSPGQPKLELNLGRLLIRRGERERGKRLMEAGERGRAEDAEYNRLAIAAGAGRSDPEAHRALARWCQARRRFSRAILEWEQVLRLHPGDAEAARERAVCAATR